MKKKVLFVLLHEYTDWVGAFLSTALHVGVIPGNESNMKCIPLPRHRKLSVLLEVSEHYPIILSRICRKICCLDPYRWQPLGVGILLKRNSLRHWYRRL